MYTNRLFHAITFGFLVLAVSATSSLFAGDKKRPATPPAAVQTAPQTPDTIIKAVALFETAVYEIEMKPNCDLISFRRVDAGAASLTPADMTVIGMDFDALCNPTIITQKIYKNANVMVDQAKPDAAPKPADAVPPAKSQVELLRLVFSQGCELSALQRADGTAVDLKAYDLKFDSQCKLQSFARRAA